MTEQLLAAYAADEDFASTVDQYDQDKHGLYRTKGKNQIVVPNCQQLKARILVEMHDAQFAGHVGITKTLERISRIFWWPRMRSESDWPFFLSLAEFAVNNSWQESIQSTPFLVNTGQSPLTPALLELPGEVYCPSARKLSEWWQSNVKQARHFMEQAQQRQAYLANKGRRDVEFSPGQLVLLSTKNLRLKPGKAKKLLPRFIGPFKVLEHVGPVAVRLDLPPAMARMHPVFHVALLRPYTTPTGPPLPLDCEDPLMLKQLKDFCMFFANPNFKTCYNQLQRRHVRNRHPMLMPAFEDPSNQALVAKLQELGSINLAGFHNTIDAHSMQLAVAMQQHYSNPGKWWWCIDLYLRSSSLTKKHWALGKAEGWDRQGLQAQLALSIEQLCSLTKKHWGLLGLSVQHCAQPSEPSQSRWGSYVDACSSLTRVLKPVTAAVTGIMHRQGKAAPAWAGDLCSLLLDTDLICKLMVVAVVGQQLVMPDLGWVLNVPTQAPLQQLQQAFQQHARGADYSNTSAKEATRFTREQLRAYLLYHKVPPRDQPVGNTLVAGWQKAVQKHIAERGSPTGHGAVALVALQAGGLVAVALVPQQAVALVPQQAVALVPQQAVALVPQQAVALVALQAGGLVALQAGGLVALQAGGLVALQAVALVALQAGGLVALQAGGLVALQAGGLGAVALGAVALVPQQAVALVPQQAVALVPQQAGGLGTVALGAVALVPQQAVALVPQQAVALVPQQAVALVPQQAVALVPQQAVALVALQAGGLVALQAVALVPQQAVALVPQQAVALVALQAGGLVALQAVALVPQQAVALVPQQAVALVALQAGGLVALQAGGLGAVALGAVALVPQQAVALVALQAVALVALQAGGLVALQAGGLVALQAGGLVALQAGGLVALQAGGLVALQAVALVPQQAVALVALQAGGLVALQAGGLGAVALGAVALVPQQAVALVALQAVALVALQAGGLVALQAGGLVALQAGGLVALQAGDLVPQQAGGLVALGAGDLVPQQAGGLVALQAGGLVALQAGDLVPQQAGGLVALQAGGLGALQAGGLVALQAGGLGAQQAVNAT
ncbi:hypothetical protein QJQ45_009431 [Haematococcus lacustris]|nr:hypothetical protein QJQ45_009431 [Haematococcus lacustris]